MNDRNKKELNGLIECIAEAQRYIARCRKLKAEVEKRNSDYYYSSMNHSAVLRAGLDLKRVISKFARRNTYGNYSKTWDEVE